MAIYESGTLNTAALVVPDLNIIVSPPSLLLLNGVPTDMAGLAGVASWGPVGVPTPVGVYSDYVRNFGPLAARTFDMGTHAAIAAQHGANNLRCVRVTDGTDAAATVTALTNCITFTGKYTGTFGNNITVAIATGSAPSSWRATVVQAGSGRAPEVFDNITGTGNAFWLALAAAINNGITGQRGPSAIIVATAGVGTTAAAAATYTLTGGTDGASGVTATTVVGSDTLPRKGMYAFRGTGVSIIALCDVTDTTTWANQVAFGLAEGAYMMLPGPAGQTPAQAVTARNTGGIDTRAAKIIVGDWAYWRDPIGGLLRLVSPAAFALGRLASLAPHQSSLNKPLTGIVATQRTESGAPYSQAELVEMGRGGVDVIALPSVGGSYFSFRFGRNTSSLASEHGDNCSRMTNFLAATANAGMGKFIGRLISDEQLRQVKATLDAFTEALFQQGMVEAWQVRCDRGNNPGNRTALGYVEALWKVRYLAIMENLLVNLEGGQAVQITRLPAAA